MKGNDYRRMGGPQLAGPLTHGNEDIRVCEVCGCDFEAFEEAAGSESTMCPDCLEAYHIYHHATNWMM